MQGKDIVLTGISFVVGVCEALIYYNLGQTAGGKFAYKIPPRSELLKTAGVVLTTSIITTFLYAKIEQWGSQDQLMAEGKEKEKNKKA